MQLILSGDFAQLPPVVPEGSLLAKAIHAGRYTKYLFQSEAWRRLGLREHELDVSKRTAHPEYARLLNRVREGELLVGDLRQAFLRITPPPHEDRGEWMGLFGRRVPLDPQRKLRWVSDEKRDECVERWNVSKLHQGAAVTIHTHRTVFQCDVDDPLERCRPPSKEMAHHTLNLKAAMPVMFVGTIRNMGSVLAPAGGIGVVVDPCCEDGTVGGASRNPIVIVNYMGSVLRVKRHTTRHSWPCPATFRGWQPYGTAPLVGGTEHPTRRWRNPQREKEYHEAKRTRSTMQFSSLESQFPLKPAYGLTAHQAQGTTLNQPHVAHVDQIWEAGQLYVMLSRAVDPTLLRLKNIMHTISRKTADAMRVDSDAINAYHRRLRGWKPPIYAVGSAVVQ